MKIVWIECVTNVTEYLEECIKSLTYIVNNPYIMEIDKMSNIDPNDWKNWEEKEEKNKDKRLKKKKQRKENKKKKRREKYGKKTN